MASNCPKRVLTRRTILSAVGMGSHVLLGQGIKNPRQLAQSVLSGFGQAARQSLLKILSDPTFRGRIPAVSVRELMRTERKSSEALMLSLLPVAQSGARPPLSNFIAAAVVQGYAGDLYLGANIEFPGQALGLAVHAEQAAVANAYMYGESRLISIAGAEAPCGHCRQFLTESLDGALRVFIKGSPPTTLSALLPMPFGPADLGAKQGAFPVRETALSLLRGSGDAQVMEALDGLQSEPVAAGDCAVGVVRSWGGPGKRRPSGAGGDGRRPNQPK